MTLFRKVLSKNRFQYVCFCGFSAETDMMLNVHLSQTGCDRRAGVRLFAFKGLVDVSREQETPDLAACY